MTHYLTEKDCLHLGVEIKNFDKNWCTPGKSFFFNQKGKVRDEEH